MTTTNQPPTSGKRRRRFRLSMMESLGFFEDTVTRTTTWSSGPVATTTAVIPAVESSVDPFEDWRPTEIGKRLVTSRVRWSLVVGILMICAGVAGVAAWLYQRPIEQAADALAELKQTAVALEAPLHALEQANGQLTAPSAGAPSLTQVFLDVDAAARDLFASSAELASTQSTTRSTAADAASGALDASRILGDALAYRAGAAPILTLPQLQTDPQLIALDDAAREFGQWQARFDGVRTALPAGVFASVTAELSVVSGELDGAQTLYLDALRADDIEGAAAVLDELSDRLTGVIELLDVESAAIHDRVSERISSALRAISSLVG